MGRPRVITLKLCLPLILLQATLLSLPQSATPTAAAAVTLESERDRAALLAFKAAITHDSLKSWNGTLHFCRWTGVTCNLQRVTTLHLDSMSLGGSISPSVGNLTFLKTIHLPNNKLHGAIPQDIGRLLQLQRLNLSSNSLDGAVPASLSHCRNLETLDLATNNLTGLIPSSIGNLSSLTYVDLSTNSLVEVIPPSLGNLSSLTYVDLSTNSLVEVIPPSLGNLSSLKLLVLANNDLSGAIPVQLVQLLELGYLDLSSNGLTGEIPPLLGKLSNISVLILSSNFLTGSIPHLLGDLTSLTYFDLSNNKLEGVFPTSFTNLSSVSTLDLSHNNLEGGLPEDLGRLTSLEFFQVSENKLSGTIPSSLYNISSLQTLSVVNNQLSGTLPANIGSTLPNLLYLNMVGNRLEGPIPISLPNASMLRQIDLSSNRFSGRVPANLGSLRDLVWLSLSGNRLEAREVNDWAFLTSLANCSLLEVLILSDNDLRGVLPNSIANLSTQLQRLMMGQNQISGNIPPGIENLANLTILGFQQNLLSGSIPDSIGKLKNLQALVLFSNKFSGRIPSSFGNLAQLSELYLDGNDLQGSIPESLGNFQKLITLDLSSNQLSGSIPKEVLSLSSLSDYLDLSNNLLDGPLPLEVGRLHNLGYLNISNNKLSGEIPAAISDCQILEYLYMERNFFQGIIPSSLGQLKGIRVLDLSHNNFIGHFPDFLADLHYLQHVNLSYNNLDGQVPKNGVFGNISEFSVTGNNKLCGGIPELHLPPCSIQASKKKEGFSSLKVIIPVVCGAISLILLFGLFIACYLKRNPKTKSTSVTSSENLYQKISYSELMKATDEFSDQNLIGKGSCGSVYKGTMGDGKIDIAVKVLSLQVRGAFKTFMTECETLRNIRHRNLLKILTTCSSVDFRGNDFKALVFEFMPNGSLEQWLHPKAAEKIHLRRLNIAQRLNIATDVAAALDYLHNHCEIPIVHCDLKPSNILLDNNMTARVGDFGIARFLPRSINESSKDPSSSMAIRGSIGYIAPEYGMGGQISRSGDVYSYGILLLEMFTGKRPTDDMFKDGLTLQKFIEDGISKPPQAIGIVDPLLFPQEGEETVGDIEEGSYGGSKGIEQCLVSVIQVGLSCAKESPRERMEMKEVMAHMHAIRGVIQDIAALRMKPNDSNLTV